MSFTLQKKQKRKLRNVFLTLLGLYIFGGIGLYYTQEIFIFQSLKLPEDHVFQLDYEYEEFLHQIEDEVVINALLIKAENPKGVIFYCHGNAGSLERWSKVVTYFVAMNYDVYVMDYRQYGKSTGTISEENFYEDVAYCYEHLKQFWDEKDIIVYGRSLGSAAATMIAAENNPKRLILETPFYSLRDVAKRRFPMYPVAQLITYEFPNYKYIRQVDCPINIIHGTKDYVVQFRSAKKLFEAAPKEKTTFSIINKGGHNNLIDFKEYKNLMKSILE